MTPKCSERRGRSKRITTPRIPRPRNPTNNLKTRTLFTLLLLVGFLYVPAACRAANLITASVSITNAAGTTNGQTITVNGDVRTWTNSVVNSLKQVLTNATPAGAKTNLYLALGLAPFSQVTLGNLGSTNLSLSGVSGLAMAVTLSAGWGTVTYSTQAVTSLLTVRVPISGEASGGAATNIASFLVQGQNDLSTNSFFENSITVQNLVGRTNVQTISGNKVFTGSSNYFASLHASPLFESDQTVVNLVGLTNDQTIAGSKQLTNAGGLFQGVVSNSPDIGGNIYRMTNGVIWTTKLASPTSSNLVNYGNAISSPSATAVFSEQFGSGASASAAGGAAFGRSSHAAGQSSLAVGNGATASGDNDSAIGTGASASGTNSTALGSGATVGALFQNSTALGYNAASTASNQVMLGSSGISVVVNNALRVGGGAIFANPVTNLVTSGTNVFPAGSDISFGRYALTTLGNGINQDIIVGTNVFVEVSGPTGAFSIEGIAGGRDGKFLIILNQTGFNMTIATEGGATGNDPTAANRIVSLSGADRATTGNGAAMLIYSGAASRWILIFLDL